MISKETVVSTRTTQRKALFVHNEDPQPEWIVDGAQCSHHGVGYTIVMTGARGAMIANSIGRIHGWVPFKELTH